MNRKKCETFKSKACLTLGLFLMSLSLSSAFAENVKVFLLGGQSNMLGLGTTSELSSPLDQSQDNVLFYYNGNSSLRSNSHAMPKQTQEFEAPF